MIRKLFVLGLVLAVCLEIGQGKATFQAKKIKEYTEALIQGIHSATMISYFHITALRFLRHKLSYSFLLIYIANCRSMQPGSMLEQCRFKYSTVCMFYMVMSMYS